MSDRARILLDLALFQLGWFACVLGGASGQGFVGPLSAALILTAHLALVPRGRRVEEASAIVLLTIAGCALEAANIAAGFLSYTGSAGSWLGVPLWVVALWVLFSSIFDSTLRWLQSRLLLAAVFAAVGSPVTYVAGEALGALTVGEPRATSLVALGASWATFVPLCLWIRARMHGAGASASTGQKLGSAAR